MAWFVLVLAGVFEVIWSVAMKASHGFTRPLPSVVTVVGMVASVWLLAWAMRTIPLGTAYAIWTGIGALGAVVCGILVFHEPATVLRLVSASLVLAGIVGLKLAACR